MDRFPLGDQDHAQSSPWRRQQLIGSAELASCLVRRGCRLLLRGPVAWLRLHRRGKRASSRLLHGHVSEPPTAIPPLPSARACNALGMWLGWACCARRVIRHNVKVPRRLLSTQAIPHTDQLSKTTRNIGIIAHIDAVSIVH